MILKKNGCDDANQVTIAIISLDLVIYKVIRSEHSVLTYTNVQPFIRNISSLFILKK